MTHRTLTLLVLIAVSGPLAACGDLDETQEASNFDIEADPLPDTVTESNAVTFMREEEKLARDVYLDSFDLWGIPTFDNISEAEQKHMDAVLTLLDNRDLPDPTQDSPRGVFEDPELQALYEALSEQSAISEIEALRAGAEIEEIDLLDLASQRAAFDTPDLQNVYANLSRGSRNHLRSFVKALDERGDTYTPKHMNEDDFYAIISTDTETGGGGQRR